MSFKNTQKFYQSPIQPSNPNAGDEWVNTATNRTYQFMTLAGATPAWIEKAIAPTANVFNLQNLNVVGTTTMPGTTSAMSLSLTNIAETVNLSSTALFGVFNYNVTSQTVFYVTASSTGNIIVNIRGGDFNALNNLLSVGQSVTVALMFTNGSTGYYVSGIQVDGAAPALTKWQGGTAPSYGNANSIDSYTFSVIKTATSTYTVLAARVQFA